MNPKQEILLREKARLLSGKVSCLCFVVTGAAHDAPYRTHEHQQAAQELKNLLSERLEGQKSLSSWLQMVKGVSIPFVTAGGLRCYTDEGQDKLLETQLAWLDSLMEKFK